MLTRPLAAVILLTILTAPFSLAEVVVRVQVMDIKAKAGAPGPAEQGAPAGDHQQGTIAMTLETLPDAAGAFLSRTSLGKQVIELKGSVSQIADGQRRVRVSFSDRAEGRSQQVSTNIELQLDQPHVIGSLPGPSDGRRQIVLTLANVSAK